MNSDVEPSTSKKSKEYRPRTMVFPVTYDEFLKFVNVDEFVAQDMQRSAQEISDSHYRRRHRYYPQVYELFYKNSESRKLLLRNGLTIKPLPRFVKDRLMSFPGMESVQVPTTARSEPRKTITDKQSQSKSNSKPLVAEAQKITRFFEMVKQIKESKKRRHDDEQVDGRNKRHRRACKNTTTVRQENNVQQGLSVPHDEVPTSEAKPKRIDRKRGESEPSNDNVDDSHIATTQQTPLPPKRVRVPVQTSPVSDGHISTKTPRLRSESDSEMPQMRVSSCGESESIRAHHFKRHEIKSWLGKGLKALEKATDDDELVVMEQFDGEYMAIDKLKALKCHPEEIKKYVKHILSAEIQKRGPNPPITTTPRLLTKSKLVSTILEMSFDDYLKLIDAKKILQHSSGDKPHHVINAEFKAQYEALVKQQGPWPKGVHVTLSSLKRFLNKKGFEGPLQLSDIPPRLLSFPEVLKNTNLEEYTSLIRDKSPKSNKPLRTLCREVFRMCCIQASWKEGMHLIEPKPTITEAGAIDQNMHHVAENALLDLNANIEKESQNNSQRSGNGEEVECVQLEGQPVAIVIDDALSSAEDLLNEIINPPNSLAVTLQAPITPSPNLFQSSGETDPKCSQPQTVVPDISEFVPCGNPVMSFLEEDKVTESVDGQKSDNVDPFIETNVTQPNEATIVTVKQEPGLPSADQTTDHSSDLNDSVKLIDLPLSEPIVINDEETEAELLEMLLCQPSTAIESESTNLTRLQLTSCLENFVPAQRLSSTLCSTFSQQNPSSDAQQSAEADANQSTDKNQGSVASQTNLRMTQDGAKRATTHVNDMLSENQNYVSTEEEPGSLSRSIYVWVTQNGSVSENIDDANVVSLIKVSLEDSRDTLVNDEWININTEFKHESSEREQQVTGSNGYEDGKAVECVDLDSSDDSECMVMMIVESENEKDRLVRDQGQPHREESLVGVSDEVRLVKDSLKKSLNMITQAMDSAVDSSVHSHDSDTSVVMLSSGNTTPDIGAEITVGDDGAVVDEPILDHFKRPPAQEQGGEVKKSLVQHVNYRQSVPHGEVQRKLINRDSLAKAVESAKTFLSHNQVSRVQASMAVEPERLSHDLEQPMSNVMVTLNASEQKVNSREKSPVEVVVEGLKSPMTQNRLDNNMETQPPVNCKENSPASCAISTESAISGQEQHSSYAAQGCSIPCFFPDSEKRPQDLVQVPFLIERRYLNHLLSLQNLNHSNEKSELKLQITCLEASETPKGPFNPVINRKVTAQKKPVRDKLCRKGIVVKRKKSNKNTKIVSFTKSVSGTKTLTRLQVEERLKALIRKSDVVTVRTKPRPSLKPTKAPPPKCNPVKPPEQTPHAFRSLPLEIGKKPAPKEPPNPTPVVEELVASSTVSQILGTDCTYFESSQLDKCCKQPPKQLKPPTSPKVMASDCYILSEGIVARKVYQASFRWKPKNRISIDMRIRINNQWLIVCDDSAKLMYNFSPSLWFDIHRVLREIDYLDYYRMLPRKYRGPTILHKILWRLFDSATRVVNARVITNSHMQYSSCEKIQTVYPKPSHCLTKCIAPDILYRMMALKENLQNNYDIVKQTAPEQAEPSQEQ